MKCEVGSVKWDDALALGWWGRVFSLLPSNFLSCPKGQVIFVPGDGVLGFWMAYFWGVNDHSNHKEAYHGCDDT